MEQTSSYRTHDSVSARNARRAKRRKQAQQRLLILLIITFFLGFLAGFFIGSRKADTLNLTFTSSSEKPKQDVKKTYTNLPWNLTLVNFENALPEDFAPEELAEVDNGYEADSRIADAAKQMIADAYSQNVRIIALSAFRDYEYQTDLYENKVQRLQQEKGYSVDKAREEAKTVVAYPGTSEHQLGLALDLVDARHTKLDESQEDTAAYKWLYEHCDEYGFIVRYPNGKTNITGIIYEPWHFRYVGEEAAKVIMEEGITLEEYLDKYYTK